VSGGFLYSRCCTQHQPLCWQISRDTLAMVSSFRHQACCMPAMPVVTYLHSLAPSHSIINDLLELSLGPSVLPHLLQHCERGPV
jgi:hypothetical protein